MSKFKINDFSFLKNGCFEHFDAEIDNPTCKSIFYYYKRYISTCGLQEQLCN